MREKFVFSLISDLFINIISLIATFILITNLKVELLGKWIFLNTIFNLGFLFVDIGIDLIHYQYSAKKNFHEYFGTFLTIKIILISFNIIITLILITILQLWNILYLIYLLLLFLGKIFNELANIFLINLKSKNKIFKANIPKLIANSFHSILIIALALNISYILDPLIYLSIFYILSTISIFIFIILISKNDFTINKPRIDFALSYFKDVKPIVFIEIIIVIATYLGNLIIAYSFGYKELGYFSLINAYIIPLLLLISGSLITIYLTLFSQYFEKEDFNSIKQLTYTIEKYSSIILLCIIIIVFLNGELIFTILLPKYKKSVLILYIMIFIPYLFGLSQPYSYQIFAGKNIKTTVNINLFVYISIIILMIILIPKNFVGLQMLGLGNIGYALAQTIPLILWAILTRYYTNKYYGIEFQKKVFLHIPFAFLTFLVAFFLKNWFLKLYLKNLMALLISSSLVAIAIFLFLLLMFKELKREDFNFFLQILNYKNYINSLKDEFIK